MSDQNPRVHRESNPPPPPRGNPIPIAEVNSNPNAGRVGPVINLQTRPLPDGIQNRSRHPGLNLAARPPNSAATLGESSTEQGTADKGEGKVKGAEEEGEVNAEDDDSDFELLDHPIMTPLDSPQTEDEAYAATSLLTEKVPPELVPVILDYAEYFPHSVIASREERDSVGNSGSKVYLTAKLPDFEALEKDTAGKGGDEDMGGRPGRVRRLVFKLRSSDQGWSSFPSDHKTYRGSWSWVEVELWRKNPQTEGTCEGSSPSQQPPTDEKDEETKKANAGKYKVGSWLLQRSVHAEREPTNHEIIWDWKEDELDDSVEEKWEPGCVDTWQRGGRVANGQLVRDLRGGDELRIVMHAQYPGWRCTVDKCEVECWWAV